MIQDTSCVYWSKGMNMMSNQLVRILDGNVQLICISLQEGCYQDMQVLPKPRTISSSTPPYCRLIPGQLWWHSRIKRSCCCVKWEVSGERWVVHHGITLISTTCAVIPYPRTDFRPNNKSCWLLRKIRMFCFSFEWAEWIFHWSLQIARSKIQLSVEIKTEIKPNKIQPPSINNSEYSG